MSDENLTLTINKTHPGVAMIDGADAMAGLLLGMRARRIVACVNACKGITTDALEGDKIIWVNEADHLRLEQQRDQLLAALEITRGQWIHSIHREQCLAALKLCGVDDPAFAKKAECKKERTAALGIDPAISGSDKTVLCAGGKFLYELQPGDTFAVQPDGKGIIIANPERPPLWVRLDDDGTVVKTLVYPA